MVRSLGKCGIREASEQQKNYTIRTPRTPRFQIEQNDGSKTEICITGYGDEDKDYLKALAEESGKFIVRTNVTKKVSVLLVGSSPGWSKIEKATEKGAVLIKDPDDAVRFLQTGELPS
jgi:NAD-dependent DNA ligase